MKKEKQDAYFHIQDVKSDGGKLILSGNYILADTIEVAMSGDKPSSSGQATTSSIHLPTPMNLKWILPPRIGNPKLMEIDWYNQIKSAAEMGGYETVELDDFSYPPSRRQD